MHPICEEAGVGSPPVSFYINVSRNMKSVIIQYKHNELPLYFKTEWMGSK